jgi:hypothetical protein
VSPSGPAGSHQHLVHVTSGSGSGSSRSNKVSSKDRGEKRREEEREEEAKRERKGEKGRVREREGGGRETGRGGRKAREGDTKRREEEREKEEYEKVKVGGGREREGRHLFPWEDFRVYSDSQGAVAQSSGSAAHARDILKTRPNRFSDHCRILKAV